MAVLFELVVNFGTDEQAAETATEVVRLAGLVLADDLCQRWQLGPEWVAFGDGYRWLPYLGSKNWR
jgi:hypothetical protein